MVDTKQIFLIILILRSNSFVGISQSVWYQWFDNTDNKKKCEFL